MHQARSDLGLLKLNTFNASELREEISEFHFSEVDRHSIHKEVGFLGHVSFEDIAARPRLLSAEPIIVVVLADKDLLC